MRNEQKIVALRNGDGVLYIPEDAILAACGKDDYVNFYLARDKDGNLLVAVYHGMFCKAVAPLPSAGATSPRESIGFQRGAAGASA